MKINSYTDGWEAYRNISDIISKSRRQFEVNIANGAEVHEYMNMVSTVEGVASLLKFRLEQNKIDIRDIEQLANNLMVSTYKLVLYVGEHMLIYNSLDIQNEILRL